MFRERFKFIFYGLLMNSHYLKYSSSTKSSNNFDIRSNSVPTFNKDNLQTNPNYVRTTEDKNMTNQGISDRVVKWFYKYGYTIGKIGSLVFASYTFLH